MPHMWMLSPIPSMFRGRRLPPKALDKELVAWSSPLDRVQLHNNITLVSLGSKPVASGERSDVCFFGCQNHYTCSYLFLSALPTTVDLTM